MKNKGWNMLVDTHCHIFSNFYDGAGDIIRRARESGVEFMLNAGIDIPSSAEAAGLSEQNSCMLFSPGIHPHSAAGATREDLEALKNLAFSENACAVGETGLDYHYSDIPRSRQKELFKATILIAKTAGLPVIIHNREAGEDVLEILSAEYSGGEEKPNGIMHCFSGGPEFARECIKLNFFISFAGNLTYPGARDLREAAEAVPLGRILIETDSPFLAPQPVRGSKNEPSFLKHTAAGLAAIKGLSEEEAGRATGENAAFVLGGLKP